MMSGFLKKGWVAVWLLSALASLAMAQGSGMMGSMGGRAPSRPVMPGNQGQRITEDMVIPQFAVGDQCTTSILLFNAGNMTRMPWITPQSLQITGSIHFYHQDGTQLQVSINGSSQVSSYAFTLSDSDSVALEISAPGSITAGWALITVDDTGANSWVMRNGPQMMRANRLMATAYYSFNDNGQFVARAGVIPSLYEMKGHLTSITPVQVKDGIDTGLAIVNTNAQPVTVQLTLKDANGQTVATRQFSVPALNQATRFIDEAQLFGSEITGTFYGYVQMEISSEGVVALGLLTTGGVLTSIPTQHYGLVTMF